MNIFIFIREQYLYYTSSIEKWFLYITFSKNEISEIFNYNSTFNYFQATVMLLLSRPASCSFVRVEIQIITTVYTAFIQTAHPHIHDPELLSQLQAACHQCTNASPAVGISFAKHSLKY